MLSDFVDAEKDTLYGFEKGFEPGQSTFRLKVLSLRIEEITDDFHYLSTM
jgi:hypothetical protein